METYSFGDWVGRRRKAQGLSQRDLAARANCVVSTIKKIEADARRPSRKLAESLADALSLPPEWRATFVDCARGLRPVNILGGLEAGDRPEPARAESAPAAMPQPRAPFVGRQHELEELTVLVTQPACRLLTLVGPGGIGKTRLALEAARTAREQFPDGVSFVPLAAVTDAALLPTAIAQSVHLVPTGPPEAQLAVYLRSRRLLLVLDNCEQLGAGSAWLAELLAQAPGLKLLATSREPLQLAEEWLYRVPELDSAQAAELFAQAARRAQPSFDPAAELQPVEAIGRLVEHLPLALELAAGWVPFMSCARIVDHIRRDLDFLAANVRNVPERHRSLRAVFHNSWLLLTADEQVALMRLSAFGGGWTAMEAEPVAGAPLPMLRALAEKSLVRVVGDDRFDLHEVTRLYALDMLRAAGLEAETRRQHATVYLALAERLDSELLGPDAVAGYTRLEREQDNFRAAFAWALTSGSTDSGLRLAKALFRFWLTRSYLEEGRLWLERLLAQAGEGLSLALNVNALTCAAFLAARLNDAPAAQGHAQRAVAICEAAGEAGKPALAHAMASLVMAHSTAARSADDFQTVYELNARALPLYRELGETDLLNMALRVGGGAALALSDYATAHAFLGEGLANARAAHDPYQVALALNYLGDLARFEQDFAAARAAYQESEALLRGLGATRDLAGVLHNLAHACLHLGEAERAQALFRESLLAQQALANAAGIAECLLGFAALAVEHGRPGAGARLLAAATAAEAAEAASPWPAERMEYEHYLARIRAELSEAQFSAEAARGRLLSTDQAVEYALRLPLGRRPGAKWGAGELTAREREVAALIARGRSNDEIAAELVVSKRTVEKHIGNILSKLGLSHRAQIVRWALDNGLT